MTASIRTLLLVTAATLATLASGNASADEAERSRLVAQLDGREMPLPTLKADFDVRIQGDLATVRVVQLFENPYDEPIHARYVFPLPADAAVHAMRLVSGDQMIEAEIHPKKEARAVFENAKKRGNQAALLDQHRPNVFTQEVANLLPGLPVRVELDYAHAIPKRDGAYRFHLPTVVGPRFLPGHSQAKEDPEATALEPESHLSKSAEPGAPTRHPGEPEGLEIGVWRLPASVPVAGPSEVDSERIAIRVSLDGGMPVRWFESPTHALHVEAPNTTHRVAELAAGRSIDDRDFELDYRLDGPKVAAGLTATADGNTRGSGFFSLLLEPPATAPDDTIAARELVFVLDCSGSMGGVPLETSKRFMRRTLRKLRPRDSFRIIRFSDSANQWSETPLPATEANTRAAERYVDQLSGSGGTHMASGIRAALEAPTEEGVLRIVVFLTDGYIGNDIEIVRLLEQQRGEARLFSFGIGHSVNRYLIEQMARVGRGASRIVKPNGEATAAADEWVARLASPVLTNIEVDWGDAPVADLYPQEIPDLFLGQTVRVVGRFTEAGTHRIAVRGRIAGKPVSLPLDAEWPGPNETTGSGEATIQGKALPIVWARAQIEDRMLRYLEPGLSEIERKTLRDEVTDLGLAHRLMTQWTSFVAVAKPIVNPGGLAHETDVAVAQVKDVPDAAYPPSALPKSPSPASPLQTAPLAPAPPRLAAKSSFAGHAAPEPSTWLALLAIALTASLWLRFRPAAH